jgi:hypothetical protein
MPVHGDRWRPPGIGPNAKGGAIGDDLDITLKVGPEDRDPPVRGERSEGLRRRVPVLVAHARRDDRHRRLDGVDETRSGG